MLYMEIFSAELPFLSVGAAAVQAARVLATPRGARLRVTLSHSGVRACLPFKSESLVPLRR